MLELNVKVININLPSNHPILEKCRPLYEYSWFIQQIKEHLLRGISRDEAIIQAMQDCEEKGYLAEFLREHGTEAVNMLFTEFNMEDALEVRYEEGVKEGKKEGIKEGRQEGTQRVNRLIQRLLEQSRGDEIGRMIQDKGFQETLFKEFGL